MTGIPLIRAQGIAKRYRVGGPERPADNLRELVTGTLLAPWRRWQAARATALSPDECFWALDDVSFDVGRGEVLGLIGRNGAGKSTLLKVISRITEPTRGRIELRGRVASLLEVGTGFHQELTGRENVYMNGTILGMRKREIDRKFDEIVAFAEVARFIDTPVKRYSSGMYVRLAFAVAAHLEPEILVVDEVLAVGDAEFQSKCLGKMSDVAHEGRTVLFVSHNMAAMRALCTRAILLERGRVVLDGNVETAIKRYLAAASARPAGRGRWTYRGNARATKIAVEAVELLVNGQPSHSVQAGDRCTFRIHYRALTPEAVGSRFAPQIQLAAEGQKVAALWPTLHGGSGIIAGSEGTLDCTIEKWPFRSRNMSAELLTFVGQEVQEHIIDGWVFASHDGDYHRSGVVPSAEEGFVFLEHAWTDVSQRVGRAELVDAVAAGAAR